MLATENLAALIRKKHQILVQLREIGVRQQKLADDSQTTSLLQLLGAKQHLIGALQIVERNLRPFQEEDPEQRTWRTQDERADCARRAQECQQLLAEVMELERQQEAKMVERRDEVIERLRRAGSAQHAATAYGEHRRVAPVANAPVQPTIDSHLDLTSGTP